MNEHFTELAKTTDALFILSLQEQLIQVRKEKAGLIAGNSRYRVELSQYKENNRLGVKELIKLNNIIGKLTNAIKSYNLSDYQESQRMVVLNYIKVMMK